MIPWWGWVLIVVVAWLVIGGTIAGVFAVLNVRKISRELHADFEDINKPYGIRTRGRR